MPLTVKHSKVSMVADGPDSNLVRPSDWNADHSLVGTLDTPQITDGAVTDAKLASATLQWHLVKRLGIVTANFNFGWLLNDGDQPRALFMFSPRMRITR